ncbi:MAG: hypothetical protein J7647_11055 [Cyanobacteria bacterium SBLK]|nr:hypothetical protein [Cyanobacteria bacterium SBLK]
MSEPFFPPPFVNPDRPDDSPILERLNIYDGLAIDAKRWKQAHHYHRKRQNLIYQSLNQPGIAYGLGVRPISAPEGISSEFSQIPWLEIQPGIAIDWEGNPIIVPQPETMPLDLPKLSQPITIYLVISYRDPEQLNLGGDREILRESFRLDLFSNPPQKGELELCRFTWESGGNMIELRGAKDVFYPQANELDLRYRMSVSSQPRMKVKVGILTHRESFRQNFIYFQKSASTLYSELQISLEYFNNPNSLSPDLDLTSFDLFYCLGSEFKQITEENAMLLKSYLKMGGILWVDLENKGWGVEKQLVTLLDKPKSKFMSKGLKSWRELELDHPLHLQPFLFSLLPNSCKDLKYAEGILAIDGNLCDRWRLTKNLDVPRQDIRTAQEFGINILHFAWQRRRLNQLSGASHQNVRDR